MANKRLITVHTIAGNKIVIDLGKIKNAGCSKDCTLIEIDNEIISIQETLDFIHKKMAGID